MDDRKKSRLSGARGQDGNQIENQSGIDYSGTKIMEIIKYVSF